MYSYGVVCMKKIIYCLILSLIACELNDPDQYVLSADFDENDKIFVVFLPQDPVKELIVKLSEYENVGVILASADDKESAESTLIDLGAKIENVGFFPIPDLDIWVRDNGPAIVKNRNGQLRAVDFRSNVIEFENNDQNIARELNIPLVRSKLRSVGGARESNGEGTVIMTENYFDIKTDSKRKKMIEEELKKICGVDRVIWLKKGLIEDEAFAKGPIFQNIYPVGSGGHIDEFCRFVNKNTVLLAEVQGADHTNHPINVENHNRLEENMAILKEFEINDIHVIRIPTADLMFDKYVDPSNGREYETVIMASYLNFVIGNKVVIAAKYFEDGMMQTVKDKDDKVKEILQGLFPNHKIIQINPKYLNSWGGGYHCMTYNLPKQKNNNEK